MSAFKVVRRVPRIVYDERVLLETDDWLEAEEYLHQKSRTAPIAMAQELPTIKGVHPTHDFPATDRVTNCRKCGAYSNGSYGSHAPCGFDFEGKSLHQILAETRGGTDE